MTNKVTPQITTSEIEEWENKFKESVSPMVKFDAIGENGSTMKMYNGQSGIEAVWSGVIMFGSDNFIRFKFSLQNGCNLQCNTDLNDQTAPVINSLYNFFMNWKEEWGKELSIPSDAEPSDMTMNPSGAVGAQSTPAPAASLAERENQRTKENIIGNNRDRLMRLAKLK